ncbi:tryptophan synthase beta subunit-like PLP-dependent enzyme [Boletus edulis]|nr:tryptophan synthase beta subunit-like PLP-dependent enzyme [Boletus edulis]
MAVTTATPEYSSHAPEPLAYPSLAPHYLLASNEPDYLRLILSSKVYDVLKETPLVYAPNLSAKFGNDIWLKREDLQEVFSFKIRGAYNFMANIREEDRWMGVITCSAGNHAQGVALSGTRLGIPCTIVMPNGTPSIKVANVQRLGAKVVLHGSDFDEAKAPPPWKSSNNCLIPTAWTVFLVPLVVVVWLLASPNTSNASETRRLKYMAQKLSTPMPCIKV